jgi:hypothetical protein
MSIPYITARQWIRQTRKEGLRREFRSRQFCLAASAAVQMLAGMLTGYHLLIALGVLLIQAGSVEALRFRKCGTMLQTKRAIWRGSTPHDARFRHLLGEWQPFLGQSIDRATGQPWRARS